MRLPHSCIHALQEGYSYVSVQMPWSLPYSLSDLAAHCENDVLSYWQTPSGDLALLGIGNALSSPLHSLEDLRRMQDTLGKAVYEISAGSTGDGDDASDGDNDRDGAGFIFLGAALYDSSDIHIQRLADRAQVWGELSEGYFFVPSILIRVSHRSCTITFNIEAHCVEELSQRWQKLSDYSHQLLERYRAGFSAPSASPADPFTATVTNVTRFDSSTHTEDTPTHTDDTAVTPSTPFNSTETFSRERWTDAIETIKTELSHPDLVSPLKKVVLARRLHLSSPTPINVYSVLEHVRTQQSHTYTFMLTVGDHSFISATPERLLWADSCELRSASIAGSAPRGHTPAEDEQLEAQLLTDTKNYYEHQVVVDYIASEMERFTQGSPTKSELRVLKNNDIQHLEILISGWRIPHTHFIDAVAALHPTPALCGSPKKRAMEIQRELEPVDRGLYGGLLGWMSPTRDTGEFAVGIRSGLVHGTEAYIYAGCGIVEQSDDEQEWQETARKFRPMMRGICGE